ncbi:MAG: sporulation integral membrane protein YtvI [Firmicutes bacterium]|nr:sporulation integral membrane protein YtvI [Bacillota bacterium]
MKDFYRKHWDIITNIALLALTLFIAAVAFKLIIPYFLPFLLALILAIAIDPLVKLFLRFKIPRAAATGLAMLVTVGALTAIMSLAVSKLIAELAKLLANIPSYTGTLKHLSFILTHRLQLWTEDLPPEVAAYIHRNTDQIARIFSENMTAAAKGMLKVITSLPNQFLLVVIVLIATFFLSKDLVKLQNRLLSWIPEEMKCKLDAMTRDLYRASIGFVRAQIILSAISGLTIMVGLLILKTEYVILASLFGAVASPIPVLGVGLLFIPWIACALLTGNLYLALGLTALFTVVIVVKHSLEPKVLGENIGIDPLSVLISLYVGYELLGVYGFILGPFVLITYNALQKAKAFAWIFKREQCPVPNGDGDADGAG